MRLLNTRTLKLQEFASHAPAYAILSHTWGSEEVVYQEMVHDSPQTQLKEGYRKIAGCCKLALSHGFDWVWVDTCCIDKSSSAELSEAINSMFQWYQQASICFAYLADVPYFVEAPFLKMMTSKMFAGDEFSALKNGWGSFTSSRWFSRGWTLQELLAPRLVSFHASDWSLIGTKHDLASLLEDVTQISQLALEGNSLKGFSVRTRMQWAAGRTTTRTEDMAYCLLGIFDINMPLLYGEGNRAFQRLQEEIFNQTEDYSLLLWSSFLFPNIGARDTSVFAAEPKDFTDLRFSRRFCPTLEVENIPKGLIFQHTFKLFDKPENILIPNRKLIEDNIYQDDNPTYSDIEGRTHIFAFDSPIMSARGILITMLLNMLPSVVSDEHEWLAWTSLNIRFGDLSYGICIGLKKEGKALEKGTKAARMRPQWLYLVPENMLQQFEPSSIYLRATPSTVENNSSQSIPTASNIWYGRGEVEFDYIGTNVPEKIIRAYPSSAFKGSWRAKLPYAFSFTGNGSNLLQPLGFDCVWAFIIEFGERKGLGALPSIVLLVGIELETMPGRLYQTPDGSHLISMEDWTKLRGWHCDLVPVPKTETIDTMHAQLGCQEGFLQSLSSNLSGPVAIIQSGSRIVGAVASADGNRLKVKITVYTKSTKSREEGVLE
ncbi:HET domain-containing protein [Colletotrichum truncatum]|uniref:HET domain-containing protein n=1 Tax=Colletotrichum truncatum TaxID=5467 RepID=A0ACC3YHA9_COLTU|nr:HET domain-containing protein [Colletotrichum truncatum]KAF6792822.1 HET domain-containing protein [Colletotrichum truncatum]